MPQHYHNVAILTLKGDNITIIYHATFVNGNNEGIHKNYPALPTPPWTSFPHVIRSYSVLTF